MSESKKEIIMMKFDFKNAYNSLSRNVFKETIKEHFPRLSNWVNILYEKEGTLLLGEHKIFANEGVIQGEVLSGAIFSICLQKTIQKINNECNLSMNVWYIDDGTIIGTKESVLFAEEENYAGFTTQKEVKDLVKAKQSDI